MQDGCGGEVDIRAVPKVADDGREDPLVVELHAEVERHHDESDEDIRERKRHHEVVRYDAELSEKVVHNEVCLPSFNFLDLFVYWKRFTLNIRLCFVNMKQGHPGDFCITHLKTFICGQLSAFILCFLTPMYCSSGSVLHYRKVFNCT